MKRNTPLAILHVINATSHLQRRKVLLIILRFARRYLVMIRGRKKSYILTSVLIASDAVPTDRICTISMHLSSPEIEAVGSCSDHVIRCSVHSQHRGVRFNHVKLFICGFIFVGAWRLLRWLYVVLVWYLCFYIMSPALSCKSSLC